MMVVQDKAKQYLLIALKVFILMVTFGYIYHKLIQDEGLVSSNYIKNTISFDISTFFLLLFFLSLTACNWFFEVLKWKYLVSTLQPISLKKSLQQTLVSLTVSLATPNRIGEYGAKAYFFKKEDRKTILVYTLFTNSYQMFITLILGVIGFLLFLMQYNLQAIFYKVLVWSLFASIILVIAIIFRKKTILIKGLSLQNIFNKHQKLTANTKVKLAVFSLIRYFCFGSLFLIFLQFYGASIDLKTCIPLLFLMYLLASVVPTIFIFDIIVKGGIAVWLFSFAGVPEIIIISTVLSMWVLNFVLPSLLGSYYLLVYKSDSL